MTNQSPPAAYAGQVQIGNFKVNRLGLGTNRITDVPAAHELLKHALTLDINFIDTANVYRDGASEATIGNTLAPFQNGLLVATKGGMQGASPEQIKGNIKESLQRLKSDHIDLYQLHRVDPAVPLTTTMHTLKELQAEGVIRYIGLSEVTVEQIKEAQKIAPIVSVQNEYNLYKRQHQAVLDYCTEQEIAFIPWFPLGGLSGETANVNKLAQAMAEKYGALPQQIALAWLLAISPMMLPIPGTLSIEHLESNLHAAAIQLDQADVVGLSLAK